MVAPVPNTFHSLVLLEQLFRAYGLPRSQTWTLPWSPKCLDGWRRSQAFVLCWGSPVAKVSWGLAPPGWRDSPGLGPFYSPRHCQPLMSIVKVPWTCCRCGLSKEQSLQSSSGSTSGMRWHLNAPGWIGQVLKHTLLFPSWEAGVHCWSGHPLEGDMVIAHVAFLARSSQTSLESSGDWDGFQFLLSLNNSNGPSVYSYALLQYTPGLSMVASRWRENEVKGQSILPLLCFLGTRLTAFHSTVNQNERMLVTNLTYSLNNL